MSNNHADVAILMGSKSDLETMRPAAEVCRKLGLRVTVRVLSAHRTPEQAAAFVREASAGGTRVFICGAGGAAHLAGAVAAHTTRPVIGVPIASGSLQGFDSLLSTAMMPPGVPVATVAVGGAENAGLLAAQMIALADAAAGGPGGGRARSPPGKGPRGRRGGAQAVRRRPEAEMDLGRGGRRAPPRRRGGLPDRDLLRPGGGRPRRDAPSSGCCGSRGGAPTGPSRSSCRTGPWSSRCARRSRPRADRADGGPLAGPADAGAAGPPGAAAAPGDRGRGGGPLLLASRWPPPWWRPGAGPSPPPAPTAPASRPPARRPRSGPPSRRRGRAICHVCDGRRDRRAGRPAPWCACAATRLEVLRRGAVAI